MFVYNIQVAMRIICIYIYIHIVCGVLETIKY